MAQSKATKKAEKPEVKTQEAPIEQATVETKPEETGTEQKSDENTDASETKDNILVPTEQVKEPEAEETVSSANSKTAKRLMHENGVKIVYRTDDGYWFLKPDMAEQHKAKIGGEIETFNEE